MALPLQMLLLVECMSLPALPPGSFVNSRSDCVTYCFHDETCHSIFYDRPKRKCHISEENYDVSDLTEVSSGMEYLVLKTGDCREDYTWNRLLAMCYKLHTTKRNWNDAQAQCQQEGGDLIKCDTNTRNNLINGLADAYGYVYIGGIRYDDMVWRWGDNSTMVKVYWDVGQPGASERCVFVFPTNQVITPGHQWHDVGCTGMQAFACETPLTSLLQIVC